MNETTESIEEATRDLLALKDQLKVVDDGEVKKQYGRLVLAWDSDCLVAGSPSEVESVIRANLLRISQEDGFRHFIVECNKDEGYAGIVARFPRSVVPIRLWRTATKYYVCGNRLFRDSSGSQRVAVAPSPASAAEQNHPVPLQSRHKGQLWHRILKIILTVALGALVFWLWAIASIGIWARVLFTAGSAAVYTVARIWLWSIATDSRDRSASPTCRKCGTELRKEEHVGSGQIFWACPQCGGPIPTRPISAS